MKLAVRALALAALLTAGCSGGDGETVEGPVTVYVSLPLTGPAADGGKDAADGARLALEEAGGAAGDLEVRAEFLDGAGGRRWDPILVGQNARAAAADSSTAAYIGELESEPTRASAPITNEAGIVQVSPGAGAVDLTQPAEGYPDSPDRYRPAGDASFARNVPADSEVLAAVADRAIELGLRTVSVELDDSPFGELSAQEFERSAEQVGVEVVAGGAGGATLSADDRGFVLRGDGVTVFAAPLASQRLPSASFASQFSERFGREPGPYAAYGYDAMQVALDAIDEAQGSAEFRPSVVDAVLDSEHPDSVLGRYSISDEGDTTLCAVQPYDVGPGGLAAGAPVCPSG